MKKKLLLTSIAAAAISSAAVAEEMSSFEAFVGAGYYYHDDDRSFDDALSLELGAEKPLNEMMSVDLWLSKYEVEGKYSSAELDALRINPGLLFHLNQGDLRPFISAGISHLIYETSAGVDHNEATLNLGVGVKKYYDNNLILRGEFLASNSFDHEALDLGVRFSAGYAFGRKASAAPAEEPVKEEVAAAPVEAAPVEPAPVPVVQAPVEPAPAPAPVVVKDSDNDGVADDMDKCSGTDAAFKVDETGCPITLSETVSIKMDVKFPSGSSVLSKDNYPEVEKVADFMNQFKDTVVTVEGYSDDRGNDAYNKKLSQRRADAVRKVLISEFGLSTDRVKSIGYGEENPIADNSTAEGRAANRRVVAVVESSVEKAVMK